MGPRNAILGGGDACELRHRDLRWSSLWGHDTFIGRGRRMRTAPVEVSVELPMGPRNAVLGGGDACELRHSILPS
eukprot:3032752-Pyramimonas_sp.AAC.1